MRYRLVMLEGSACHSWPQLPSHQYFTIREPAITDVGDRLFLLGCHNSAISGCVVARSLNPELANIPLQILHPFGLSLLVRVLSEITSCHSWPHLPSHHTDLEDEKETSCGLSGIFLFGCQSSAIKGRCDARSLNPIRTLRPIQKGHGELSGFLQRSAGLASKSWPREHCHQYLVLRKAGTEDGSNGPFLSGCQSFAIFGACSVIDANYRPNSQRYRMEI